MARFTTELGANVKALSNQLRHASAAMTQDIYADHYDSDMDAIAASVGEMIA